MRFAYCAAPRRELSPLSTTHTHTHTLGGALTWKWGGVLFQNERACCFYARSPAQETRTCLATHICTTVIGPRHNAIQHVCTSLQQNRITSFSFSPLGTREGARERGAYAMLPMIQYVSLLWHFHQIVLSQNILPSPELATHHFDQRQS
jgi:hypothetical protein